MFQVESLIQFLLINSWLRVARLYCCGVRIGWGSWIKSRVSIGRGSAAGSGFIVRGTGTLTIGRYCAIGESVRIITSNHDMKGLSLNYLVQDRLIGKRMVAEKKDVEIGNDVWIGDGTILLPGIEVGDGVVIGAGAVVTKSVEPFKVVAGNPARTIRDRFSPEIAEKIRDIAWWNMSEEEQKRIVSLFESVDIRALDLEIDHKER